ncbi:MAG: hypothetical protein M3126_07660 [Candidatus Eremiobacteraeota bacterium]|nr:hypothetical protein [Candidatus Eremiobacteraeota bacterium]
MTPFVRPLVLLTALAVFALATASRGFAQQPAEPDLSAILAKLAADPTTPNEYSAAVKLHVHLRVFPWISVTLNGNQAYKRPGLYHFVFRGVPRAAERFHDLNYDLGNPQTWPAKYDISLLTPASATVEPVVRLVPKKRGLVKNLDVTIDPVKGHIDKAVWNRFDGGVISLVNHYNAVGSKELVAEQQASINVPHMRADLDAEYSEFSVGAASTATKTP